MVKSISYYGARTYAKNTAKYVILLHSSHLSSCHQRRVTVVQGTVSSQATFALGTWCETYSSLWEASHWLHRAMVLSGTLGEGLREAARLHHSCGAVTFLASPCAISNCPLSTFTMQFKLLWVHTCSGSIVISSKHETSWYQNPMKHWHSLS